MIALHKIPYVTNLPDDGQTKIIWIKNGELLEGASTNHGHDGVLNATGVQIQENVEVLEVNIKNVANSLNETNATVEKLEELIAIAGNLDLVEQVKTNTDDIKLVKTEQESLNETVETTSEEVNQVIQELGSRSVSSGSRTVFDDLVFIKSVVGQEPGQDINGNMSPGAKASGIIRKLGDTTKQVITNTNNIAILSALVESADLPKLVKDVVSFRKELGPVQPNTLPMYTRLNTLETDSEKTKEEIEKISNSIGIDSRNIVEELDTLSVSRVFRRVYIGKVLGCTGPNSFLNETTSLTSLGRSADSTNAESIAMLLVLVITCLVVSPSLRIMPEAFAPGDMLPFIS
jgi:hypothetical protein